MKTIHEANGRGARVEESRAPAVVKRIRHFNPALIDALLDPANIRDDGQPKVTALARALGRPIARIKQDLAAIREAGRGSIRPRRGG